MFSSQNTAQGANDMSITSRFKAGEQVTAVQAIEVTLQRLQSSFDTMRNGTKDLPKEINELRNKILDLESQLAPAAFSKAFASTSHTLTTESELGSIRKWKKARRPWLMRLKGF